MSDRSTHATVATNTPAIASDATALAANTARIAWHIQNLGTNPLFVRLGAGASTTVFHVVLKVDTGNDAGAGGFYGEEGTSVYTGVVTIAGTSPRYTVMERAP